MFSEEKFRDLRYLLKYPRDYAPGKAYPVILFLHGAGTRGEDMEKLKANPFFEHTRQYTDFPFLVAAPLCADNSWHDRMETLRDFARYLAGRPDADPERLCLMGVSMGGFGVWQMAMSDPGLYAAAVPICGGGMRWNAGRLKNLALWAFHGALDRIVETEESVKMVEKINSLGGRARLTVYPDCYHDAWTRTYNDPEVFRWLLCQRRGQLPTDPEIYTDSRLYG